MNARQAGFYFSYLRLSAFICGLIFLSACFNSNQNTNSAEIEQPVFEAPTPQINLHQPLEISQKPEDLALAKKIDELIERIFRRALGSFRRQFEGRESFSRPRRAETFHARFGF